MEQIELKANNREVLGKKVRFLRREGVTPAHVFGHDITSVALQCDTANLRRVLAKTGETRLIFLKVDGENEPRSVVVREVQRDALTGKLVHVDFYQVKMTDKIKVDVPIAIVGEAPALKIKGSFLEHEINTLAIECLPGNIPTSIELDISSLIEPEQAVRVKDIELGEEITVLSDLEQMVVKIGTQAKVDEEAVAEEAAVEAAEAAAPGEEEAKGEAEEE
ncbi:50S ribosomal protein L25 [Chloroflexota bacterium]